MEMSLLRDIEKGNPEEENQRPLLNSQDGRHVTRPLPPRPRTLGLQQALMNNNHLQLSLDMPDMTPSSIPSTVTNTPAGDSPALQKHWRRGDRRLRRLNTELLEAIDALDVEEVERLLNSGANPNATCRLAHVSACHSAAMTGGDALSLLLKFGAEKLRIDKLGRTPLHLAAYSGNIRQVAILLEFPEDIQEKVCSGSMSSDIEEDVRKLCPKIKDMTNVRCDLGDLNLSLPKTWKDNIDHNCKEIEGTLPLFKPGWTPLHVASACARQHCTRLLLAAGADPNICDVEGRTVIDVAGSAFYYDRDVRPKCLEEVIRMLLKAGGKFNSMKVYGLNNIDTPLHTAVEIESIELINLLLEAGAAVTSLNHAGLTPLHVCVIKKLEDHLQILANYDYTEGDPFSAIIDVKDIDGHTVLQAAIEAAWVPGVCVALEAGADVTLTANDGETPIHSAAALGNLDVLNEILSVAKKKDAIDYQNEEGETALFKAITHGHVDCVKKILSEGAAIKITLPGDVNIFHVAAENGQLEILKVLIDYDDDVTSTMINSLTAGDKRGFGPIHFAVSNSHTDCVDLLLSKNADIRLRTTCSPHKASTPLHIAAVKNQVEIAKVILKYDKTTVHEVNSMGWYPLHTASHHGSRDVISLLLKEGADLSGYTDGPKKYKRTAIDMIINNLSKPTDFMESVFDSYLSSNGYDLQDPSCTITIDYGILMPTVCEVEQMKVIEALMKTGNRYGQKKLLVHPLVESFLYLKWKALLPFFYTIIILYGFFVASLTIFAVSVFFYKDTHDDDKPVWLDESIWGYVVYASITLILIQELLYMNLKSSRYFLQLETWIKFGSLGLAVILPYSVMVTAASNNDWPRHVATVALLLSWLEMMFLLSRFPNWGYYVLMFGKVASNVVKILLTFAFLVIGFSLSFMIQFRSQMPFEGPWASLVKTIVMMTSEFDYGALFDEEHSKELATSLVIVRIIFLIFLILAAIVLMNLLVGVAVNDINDLEVLGNIRRLAKQVEFLGTLDTLFYNRFFHTFLPKRLNNTMKSKRRVLRVLTLSPGKPRWKFNKALPSRIRDAIFNKAQSQQKIMDDELSLQSFQKKLIEMHDGIMKINEKKIEITEAKLAEDRTARNRKYDEIVKQIDELDDVVNDYRHQTTAFKEESKSSLDVLNDKMDQMHLEIEVIKQFLARLESKLT